MSNIDALIEEFSSDPSKLNQLSEEELQALHKKLSPYGVVKADPSDVGCKNATVVSVTNQRDEYMRRVLMTSLVGFVWTMQEEWEAPEELLKWKRDTRMQHNRGGIPKAEAKPYSAPELRRHAMMLNKIADEMENISKDIDHSMEMKSVTESGQKVNGKDHKYYSERAEDLVARLVGLEYTANRELFIRGMEADDRLDGAIERAKSTKGVMDVIANDFIVREEPETVQLPKEMGKEIVKEFLGQYFEFNPHVHVRSSTAMEKEHARAAADFNAATDPEAKKAARARMNATAPNVKRIREATASEPLVRLSAAELELKRPEIDLVAMTVSHKDTGCPELEDALTIARASHDNYNVLCRLLREPDMIRAAHIMMDPARIDQARAEMFKAPKLAAAKHYAPQDSFHRWKFYEDVNLEALRTVTAALYNQFVSPDIDFAINVMETFTEGEAGDVKKQFEKFRSDNERVINVPISLVPHGSWVCLSSVRGNRERTEFLNSQTDALKQIIDRVEKDQGLGEELMKKRVHNAKAKNIRETGVSDASGLNSYKSNIGSGTQPALSERQRKTLDLAKGDAKLAAELEQIDELKERIVKIKRQLPDLKPESASAADLNSELGILERDLVQRIESLEVPDDAVQIDMFVNDGNSLTKQKIYTKADKPAEIAEQMAAARDGAAGAGASR
jgi:hypothetical protein